MPIALAVLGGSGKMGSRVYRLAQEDPDFHVVETSARSNEPSSLLAHCDVAIDFTSPEATSKHLEAAILTKKGLVIGTTGHLPEIKKAIEAAAKEIPILFSPNFSFGMALCLDAAARIGREMPGCSIRICETHHAHKKDSPSGTALALAQAVGKDKASIQSVRSGEVVGEHTIVFEWGSERIEIKHTAHSRDAFAQGALLGAKFLVKQPPGLYSLKDLYT